MRASLLRCIEQLHEKELRQHAKDMPDAKIEGSLCQVELEKKIGTQRRAGNVEGESQVKILEVKHREELARLQAELDEAQGARSPPRGRDCEKSRVAYKEHGNNSENTTKRVTVRALRRDT